MEEGVSSWTVDRLSGDRFRLREFLRLLGDQNSAMEGRERSVDRKARSAEYSDHTNANMWREYDSGLAYQKRSKREGLGSGGWHLYRLDRGAHNDCAELASSLTTLKITPYLLAKFRPYSIQLLMNIWIS